MTMRMATEAILGGAAARSGREELEPTADILLVDDHPSNLLALEAMLAEPGRNLVCAHSGAEALKCLLDQDFAVILLDVQMPDMDGFETAALIRERERSRHTPIIFLTAFGRSDTQIVQGYALGAVDFLFKPIVPEILKSKVAVFVDLHKKTEEVRRQAERLHQAEQREHERRLAEARQRWEADQLRQEMEKERRVAHALSQKADELARSVLERERAEAALRRSNERLQLLSEIAGQLLLEPSPRELLQRVFERLSEHLGLEVYLCHLVTADGDRLRLDSYGGIPATLLHGLDQLAFGEGVSGSVAVDRQPMIIERLQTFDDASTRVIRGLGLTAYVSYPLLAHDRLIGTLDFATRTRDYFYVDELAVLKTVSDQSAMALERARLIDELQKRAKELADADRRKDEFLAMLAHELRNPLAPLLNALYVLRQRNVDGNALERAHQVMERQVRYMARLVDDLLDVARITRGRIELRRERVAIGALVDQAVQTSQPLIRERRHQLLVTLPTEPVFLDVDPTRIAQVIANLLNNAAKYTDPGGQIWLSAWREDGQLALEVRDSGVGIASEILPRIFDLFVQSDRSLDRSQGGLGIGLTLVRRLIELHGGSVIASSAGLGAGSCFVVYLPVGAESGQELARGAETVLEAARLVEPVPEAARGVESVPEAARGVEGVPESARGAGGAQALAPGAVIGLAPARGVETRLTEAGIHALTPAASMVVRTAAEVHEASEMVAHAPPVAAEDKKAGAVDAAKADATKEANAGAAKEARAGAVDAAKAEATKDGKAGATGRSKHNTSSDGPSDGGDRPRSPAPGGRGAGGRVGTARTVDARAGGGPATSTSSGAKTTRSSSGTAGRSRAARSVATSAAADRAEVVLPAGSTLGKAASGFMSASSAGFAPAYDGSRPAPPDTAAELSLETGAALQILLIEDNEDIRDTMRDVLELYGHKVEVAENGVRGVQLALESHPQIALIDIGLPGMDGYQVAKRVRAGEGGDRIMLIALTGYGQPNDRRRALEAGFDDHMVKPVTIEALSRVLTSVARASPGAG